MRPPNIWTIVAFIGAALVAIPIVVMCISIFDADPQGVWAHLTQTVLWRYIWGSFAVTTGAVTIAALIGTGTAWLVVRSRFPGQRIFRWALLLPMAMPAYVLAYCWTDLLEFAGPVQTMLREATGWAKTDYWFPEIRSLPGAIAMMGLVLYPYVYLTSRAAFLEQGSSVFETARSLGWGPWHCFLCLTLPLARPAIATGCALVAMECLADYGTVDYFGVQTFTTGIYRTWEGFGSYTAATRLAALLLLLVTVVIALERLSRGNRQFFRCGSRQHQNVPMHLHGSKAWLATAYCAVPVLGGFLIPAVVLGRHALNQSAGHAFTAVMEPALMSLKLAMTTAIVAVAMAIVIAYGRRLDNSRLTALAGRIAGTGYAIPGSVIAVAVIVPLTWVDNELLDPLLNSGLLLSGTLFTLIFAYLVRFLAVAMGTVKSGLGAITPGMDLAARSLGCRPGEALRRVHLPLMWASTATAALMVFVDVLKELPATVLLRPFNVSTLAVRVHEQVSQESLHLAALPALTIVIVGLFPVLILTHSITKTAEVGGAHG